MLNKLYKAIYIFVLTIVLILVFDFGVIQNFFDSRVAVEDATVGGDFLIIEVDGKPVEKVKHGIIVSKVPLPLIEPGKRVISFSKVLQRNEEFFVLETEILKGHRYKVSTENNKPVLQIIKN